MKTNTLICYLICAVALFGVTPRVLAEAPFDQIIAFGVSYEDIGQFPDIDFVSEVFPGLVAPPGAGLDGSTGFRLTNLTAPGVRGQAWVEMLSEDLGIGGMFPSTPLLYPGDRTDIPDTQNVSFAFAGARADDVLESVVGESFVVHPVADLVPEFDLTKTSPGFLQRLESGALTLSPNALVVVNSGGNDVRDADVDDPEASALAGAASTLEAIEALVDAGAGTILVPTFPPLGLFSEVNNVEPDGSRTPLAEARNVAASVFNGAILQGLPAIGGNVVVVDFSTLFLEMLADPAGFGFNSTFDHSAFCYSNSEWSISGVNCTEPEGLGKADGGDPGDFIFNDGLHPTQAAARILADYTMAVLTAPGMAALLPEAALGDARAFGNTIADYQAQNRWRPLADSPVLFGSVQGGETDLAEAFHTPDMASDSSEVTLGVSSGFGERWMVGGAIGLQRRDVELGSDGTGFDSSGVMGSVFFGYRGHPWFADVSFTLGKTDLDDLDRRVRLGPTLSYLEQGETETEVAGVAAGLGFDLIPGSDSLRFGPYAGLDYMDVKVDGYTEVSDRSTAMVFGKQKRESLLADLGVFASVPLQVGSADVELFGDVLWRNELEDDARTVTASVKSLALQTSFELPGYEVDDQWIAARVGAVLDFGALRMSLSGNYQDNANEAWHVTLGLAYQL
jgi:outer membrane lipase/esterase